MRGLGDLSASDKVAMSSQTHDTPDVIQRLARIDTTSLVDTGPGLPGLRVLPAALRPVRRGCAWLAAP